MGELTAGLARRLAATMRETHCLSEYERDGILRILDAWADAEEAKKKAKTAETARTG